MGGIDASPAAFAWTVLGPPPETRIPEGTQPIVDGGTVTLDMGNQFLVSASTDGATWTEVLRENREIREPDRSVVVEIPPRERRPGGVFDALVDSSSLKPELVRGLDIMILRELTGGVYFGEPKEIIDLGNGQKRGIDTQVYDTFEIERIGAVAFELARTRRNKVCSMEKNNVMKSGVLWKEVVSATHRARYPDV